MFQRIKNNCKRFAKSTRPSVLHIRVLKKLIKSRFAVLMENRKVDQSQFINNFELLLHTWGIREEDIPNICKDLRQRIYLYAILLVIVAILFVQGFVFVEILILIVCALGISTTTWRIFILRKKRFISYPKYLFNVCSFNLKAKNNL